MSERILGSRDIVGRRVDFTKKTPLAWGIEIEIPLGSFERKAVRKLSGIILPDRISGIRFLDLNPQESLPVKLRNIQSDWKYYKDTSLKYLATTGRGTDSLRRERLAEFFYLIFGENYKQIDEFNSLIEKNNGKEIVIVSGHGWDAPLTIGEQYSRQPYFENEARVQKRGNEVPVNRILKKYDSPVNYAGILLGSCYSGKTKICALGVPVVYVTGEFGGSKSQKGLLPTTISVPNV
ncbi:MAG: hypothetical protein HYV90_01530 [Candidatus Woesebacteria bacterium]|nr:MAG: hypothetical protein HYV90_01530 [Candidatus Woesebacteria bacterium]